MKPSLYIACAALAIAAAAPAQSMRPVDDTHCQISVPADWADSKIAGIGARSTEDRRFNAVVRGFESGEYQTVVDGMKQMKATVVEENGSHVLMSADFPGGRKQYVEITKSKPLGCRVNITFPPGKEPIARKIADSVKPLK